MIHSPFHVIEGFASPLRCEQLARQLGLSEPDQTPDGKPLKHERIVPSDLIGDLASDFSAISPILEQRYKAQISGEPGFVFQQFPENPKVPAEQHTAEGWRYLRKKWTKVKDIDLVGFLWLKDYHNSVPLDPRYEVYGGKLEFPGYNFSLTPVRGTLVLFPATPHFIHAISHVMLGSLEQIKITTRLRHDGLPWIYDPRAFPGTFQEWFTEE